MLLREQVDEHVLGAVGVLVLVDEHVSGSGRASVAERLGVAREELDRLQEQVVEVERRRTGAERSW